MYDVRRELESRQWDAPERVRRRQASRLVEILSHATKSVPFYRDRWEIGHPEVEDAFEHLRGLPVLTKEDLQNRARLLVSEDTHGRVSEKTTGGSTGQPVTVLKDRTALARERAASWLGYGWYGVEVGDRGARFWGSPAELGMRRLRFALADLAMNRIRFSAFAFDERDLEAYWRRCCRKQPDYFYGYVSMLTEFARHLREHGHDGSQLGLKVVITTAEALTGPHRELLEEVFDAPVQNEYGCGEVGAIAYECPAGSLHVMAENLLVEILKEDGSPARPGESGRVVVTDLNNRAMPLIRYEVGDRAVRGSSCGCGRGYAVLGEIQGRAYDFVRDRAGRSFHGEYFMYLFEDLRERGTDIDQFRVTQRSRDHLHVEVATPGRLDAREEAFVRRRLGRDMSGMDVSLERVDEIERLDSGKTRVIRNQWLSDAERT